tara:strand:- start:976 stop:1191 length:216 start_codon:yes stop_codon:yes gene_type:complete
MAEQELSVTIRVRTTALQVRQIDELLERMKKHPRYNAQVTNRSALVRRLISEGIATMEQAIKGEQQELFRE